MSSAIFLDQRRAETLIAEHGSPLYVYDSSYLEKRAKSLLNLCQKNNYLLRYAVKANPHPEIIKLFNHSGLHFDASSDFEAELLINNGIKPEKVSLSSQQPPKDLGKTLINGVAFVATSFHQLELVLKTGWKGEIALRINPGIGSGHSRRVTTGGVGAGFGIWHEYLPQILEQRSKSESIINRVQVHVGAGAKSSVWQSVIGKALELVKQLPTVKILNMGGGFKVARIPGESEANMGKILNIFAKAVADFYKQTGRQIQIEIEPGTWLVANGGCLLSEIVDIVDTGKNGFNFIKLNTGMNDFLRPAMYGAQHPIEVLNSSVKQADYVVVGHNCETGDIFTPAPGDPEEIKPRKLNQAKIGDLVVIGGVGAYGASMRAAGYNSFPSATEVFING